MTDNFFLDNLDLQFRLEHLELQDVIELQEKRQSWLRTGREKRSLSRVGG